MRKRNRSRQEQAHKQAAREKGEGATHIDIDLYVFMEGAKRINVDNSLYLIRSNKV